MKTVLITGASGFLGSHLVQALKDDKRYRIIGVARDTEKIPRGRNIEAISIDSFFSMTDLHVDMLVNCAFARSNNALLLANSLDYTANLAKILKKAEIQSLINISSQGVYKRLPAGELQKEDSQICPIDMYSMAKYSAEKILTASECASHITQVRLASINMKQRFLFSFINNVINGENIVLSAPYQNAALLDIKDAVSGLQALIDLPNINRKEIYNLGINKQMTVFDYACVVVNTMKEFGYHGEIVLDNSNTDINNSGMDCSQIMEDTGWRPRITPRDMVYDYYCELTKEIH